MLTQRNGAKDTMRARCKKDCWEAAESNRLCEHTMMASKLIKTREDRTRTAAGALPQHCGGSSITCTAIRTLVSRVFPLSGFRFQPCETARYQNNYQSNGSQRSCKC
eukprot:529297-Rhodomonas_salina.3